MGYLISSIGLNVSQSLVAVLNTREAANKLIEQLTNLKVVVPNNVNLTLDGSTEGATISLFNSTPSEYYFRRSDGSPFYIVVGGKVQGNVSTETKVVPVELEAKVATIVNQLKKDGYTVFSPTQAGIQPPPNTITGETKKIVFDKTSYPDFPQIPEIIPPENQSLWVVIGTVLSTGNLMNKTLISGYVASSGSINRGTNNFSVQRKSKGLYSIKCTVDNLLSVTATQLFPGNNNTGGDTRDNAVITLLGKDEFIIKTGDSSGNVSDREFSFIAIGDSSAISI